MLLIKVFYFILNVWIVLIQLLNLTVKVYFLFLLFQIYDKMKTRIVNVMSHKDKLVKNKKIKVTVVNVPSLANN